MNAAESREAELRAALEEIHEYQCGCDEPGSWAKCVCEPREVFRVLLPNQTRS